MRTRRRARSRASPTFSGSRAASRRPAASRRSTGYFPRIRKAYLIGEAAGEFAGTLQGKVPFVVAGTLDRAVELAARDAAGRRTRRKPVVLLSPACASYDQYRNFEIRGAAFRDAVQQARRRDAHLSDCVNSFVNHGESRLSEMRMIFSENRFTLFGIMRYPFTGADDP